MYPICMPDIMILAQAVVLLFCSQGCFTIQNAKAGMDINIFRPGANRAPNF